jgi:cytochrome c oxidase subunit 2
VFDLHDPERCTVRVKRRLRLAVIPIGIASAITLAGCTPTELNGFLPGFTDDGTQATNHTEMVSGLWVNSWIVLLVVGIITWALMGWAAIAYRRRRGQRACRCSCGTTCPSRSSTRSSR